MTTTIKVRFQMPGYHRHPHAPLEREYLAHMHRHVFHFQVDLGLGEPAIEPHDLLSCANSLVICHWLDGTECEFEDAGCEGIATWLAYQLKNTYADQDHVAVEVWEDGECGARVALAIGGLI